MSFKEDALARELLKGIETVDGLPTGIKSIYEMLEIGDCVRLHSLQAQSHLNGKYGNLGRVEIRNGVKRWHVSNIMNEPKFLVQEKNIELFEPIPVEDLRKPFRQQGLNMLKRLSIDWAHFMLGDVQTRIQLHFQQLCQEFVTENDRSHALTEAVVEPGKNIPSTIVCMYPITTYNVLAKEMDWCFKEMCSIPLPSLRDKWMLGIVKNYIFMSMRETSDWPRGESDSLCNHETTEPVLSKFVVKQPFVNLQRDFKVEMKDLIDGIKKCCGDDYKLLTENDSLIDELQNVYVSEGNQSELRKQS